jgi:hypothetical protein
MGAFSFASPRFQPGFPLLAWTLRVLNSFGICTFIGKFIFFCLFQFFQVFSEVSHLLATF